MLAAFVVLKGEFLKEVVAVVSGELHRDGAGSVLGSGAVQKGCEYAETDHLGEKGGYQLLFGWFHDKVERFDMRLVSLSNHRSGRFDRLSDRTSDLPGLKVSGGVS